MITNMTEKQRADDFVAAAKWIAEIGKSLNTGDSRFSMTHSFYTEYQDEAEKALKALEDLIAQREYEILQAQEAIEDYRAAMANGGQEALSAMRAQAYASSGRIIN